MIIITGVTGGIGRFIEKQFAGISTEPIIGIYHNSLPPMSNDSGKITYIKADLTIEADVINMIGSLGSGKEKIKLIHCAGITTNAMLHKMDFSDWQKVISANLDSSFLITKHLLPTMREQCFGKIIFISSVVPQIGVVGTSSYAASKAGLWGLMKTIVKENATKNITCNTLNLGYFNIGMIKDVPEQMLNQIIEIVPSKKLGNPMDIFNAIQFIFSSDYLTGSSLNINGGLY